MKNEKAPKLDEKKFVNDISALYGENDADPGGNRELLKAQ
jgi:hypothetical protein